MPFNKIAGGASNYPSLEVALAPGETLLLPTGQGNVGTYGASAAPQLNTNNTLTGQYLIQLGQYTNLQMYDSKLNYWRNLNVAPNQLMTVSSDGFNYRLANTTGCPIGALITNAGSALTNGFYGYNQALSAVTIQNGLVTSGNTYFTVTPSAGGSLWNAIIGGAINTTITFANGTNVAAFTPFSPTTGNLTASPGSGYTKPPVIVFGPPPNQGNQPFILPTAVCTLTSGAIGSVTVTNQGAGLLGLPSITVIPQPGDITGGGAVLGWSSANWGQVGSGTLLALWPAQYNSTGTGLTAVPTLSFSPASTLAATVIMNFTITSFTQTTPGVGYTTAGAAFAGGIVAGSAANTNPLYDKLTSIPIFPPITVAATTGLPALAGPFGGVNLQAVPTIQSFSAGAAASTAAVTTVVVGGANDTVVLQSF